MSAYANKRIKIKYTSPIFIYKRSKHQLEPSRIQNMSVKKNPLEGWLLWRLFQNIWMFMVPVLPPGHTFLLLHLVIQTGSHELGVVNDPPAIQIHRTKDLSSLARAIQVWVTAWQRTTAKQILHCVVSESSHAYIYIYNIIYKYNIIYNIIKHTITYYIYIYIYRHMPYYIL